MDKQTARKLGLPKVLCDHRYTENTMIAGCEECTRCGDIRPQDNPPSHYFVSSQKEDEEDDDDKVFSYDLDYDNDYIEIGSLVVNAEKTNDDKNRNDKDIDKIKYAFSEDFTDTIDFAVDISDWDDEQIQRLRDLADRQNQDADDDELFSYDVDYESKRYDDVGGIVPKFISHHFRYECRDKPPYKWLTDLNGENRTNYTHEDIGAQGYLVHRDLL